MELKRLAICGVGRMGQIRTDCVLEKKQFKVAYIVDPININLRDSIASKFGAKTASKLVEIINDIDAVILCTPTSLHAEDVKLSIENKKPVFTEKPLAFTKNETNDLYQLATKENVPIFTAYNRRAANPFKELKSKSCPKDIHRISYVFRDNPLLPTEFQRTLGDIYEDLSCHCIDLAIWYLGEKPIKVYAKGLASFNDQGIIDTGSAIFEISNQRTITGEFSRKSTTNYDERVEIFMKDKTISANMERDDGTNAYSFRESYWDSYMNEIDQFKEIVDEYYQKKTFKIDRPYECCLWVIDTVNALQRSAISGKEEYVYPSGIPVKLGIVGRGVFGNYAHSKVIKPFFWDYFDVIQVYHTQNNYKNDPNIEAVYVCVNDGKQTEIITQALNDKKHVFAEKPAFLKMSDYYSAIKNSRTTNTKLVINFNHRYEPIVQGIKKEIERRSGSNIVIELFSGDPVDRGDPQKIIRNSIIDEIDLSVFLCWPFVNAEFTDFCMTDNDCHLSIKFLKCDGTTITSNITYKKGYPSYCSRVTVVETVFENDWKDVGSFNWFNRNLPGYKAAFTAFYTAVKFGSPTETDVNHPSMYWTFSLLENALERVSRNLQ